MIFIRFIYIPTYNTFVSLSLNIETYASTVPPAWNSSFSIRPRRSDGVRNAAANFRYVQTYCYSRLEAIHIQQVHKSSIELNIAIDHTGMSKDGPSRVFVGAACYPSLSSNGADEAFFAGKYMNPSRSSQPTNILKWYNTTKGFR